ncbi:MAG: hypothetical protein H5T82_05585 [Demequina sp.]|nr:hypothetical protein [Demequina sp.]
MRETPMSTTPAAALVKQYTPAVRLLRDGRLPDGTPLTREAMTAKGAPGSLSHALRSASLARRRGTAVFVAAAALVPPMLLAVAGVLLVLALIFDRASLAALAL